MICGFIGAPLSGKSTIAAHMYAKFKKNGILSELVMEQARSYIAEIRFKNNLLPTSKIVLSDEDQKEICSRQLKLEKYMKHSCGLSTVIISDSSTLNALMYMSLKQKESLSLNQLIQDYDLLFFCNPIDVGEDFSSIQDPNRVHDLEYIKVIQHEAVRIYENVVKSNTCPIIQLNGDLDYRVDQACHFALQRRHDLILKSDL